MSLLAIQVGCASVQDCKYETGQQFRSWIAYQQYGNPSQSKYSADYRRGWMDGYYEVITGGPDCPPAIAPKRYWDPKQILKDCDNRRHSYYNGWQDGASRAASMPDTHHLKLFESPDCPMPRCQCGNAQCSGACQCEVPVDDYNPTFNEMAPVLEETAGEMFSEISINTASDIADGGSL